jgi:membrane-associated phospholipid phosphatase
MLEVQPTWLDYLITDYVSHHVKPAVEKEAEAATYLADGHLIGCVVAAYWLASRAQDEAKRSEATQMAVGVAAGLALPHILKHFVNQIRPDRTIYGPRHGIPKSGSPYDAFPSGHAVHLAVVASTLSRFHPTHRRSFWTGAIGLSATRIVLLAHWPSDVLAGLAIGKGLDLIVAKLFRGK